MDMESVFGVSVAANGFGGPVFARIRRYSSCGEFEGLDRGVL